MAKHSRRLVEWFRRLEVVDSLLSLAVWFWRLGGWLLTIFGALGGLAVSIATSPGMLQGVLIVGGGAVLGAIMGLIMARRLQSVFPPGSGVVAVDEDGYGYVKPIGLETKQPVASIKAETLTRDDRETVQQYRTLWNRHGALPVSEVLEELREAKRHLESHYWVRGITSFIDDLDAGYKALTVALSDDSVEGPGAVVERFNAMYGAYLRALEWLVDIHVAGDLATLDSEPLQRWMPHHHRFFDEIENLLQRPECRGRLHVYFATISRFDRKPLVSFLEGVQDGNFETPPTEGIFERLKHTTPDERQLLSLFTHGVGQYSTESLMPREIYQSIYGLERDGILQHQRGDSKEAIDRLKIKEGVRLWIEKNLAAGASTSRELEVRLDHVQGTGSSGGGAGGIHGC